MYGRSRKEDLDILRNEYDPRSPKLRVLLLSYLTVGDTIPTVGQLNGILDWITADREGFLEAVEASMPEENEKEILAVAEVDPYRGQYM
jgi:hypothetical protein